MMHITRVLRKDSTCVISLMILYEKRNIMICKVLVSVLYGIINHFLCAEYMWCPQTKFHVANKGFETQHTMIFQELVFQNY